MTAPAHEYRVLSFGIPSLDRLLGRRDDQPSECPGLNLQPPPDASVPGPLPLIDASVCIIGPDGTGKSLFALHLVAEHWRKCAAWWAAAPPAGAVAPKLIYASSDLSLSMARTMWSQFWLDRPVSRRRRLPFEGPGPRGTGWLRPNAPAMPEEKVELVDRKVVHLQKYQPADKKGLATFLGQSQHFGAADGTGKQVAFIDLESDTSGDDWAFLNRLLHALPRPRPGDPLHMLVIDAIEGLETLVGKRDAFGEEQDRRARVAQLVRAAAGKCHLVMVVEEPRHDERLPEVFVADVVVRLRATLEGDYSRRTVEVEKVRGQKHTRGQHDFRMRGPQPDVDGSEEIAAGGTAEAAKDRLWARLWDDYSPDYPAVGYIDTPAGTTVAFEYLSHIIAFPSLHQIARQTEAAGRKGAAGPLDRHLGPYTGFGIYHLDVMLGSLPDATIRDRATQAGTDYRGLPAGSVTTIIGREATHKSQLARAFLAMAFRTRIDRDMKAVDPQRDDPLLGQGAAVLLTTTPIGKSRLREKLQRHLIPENAAAEASGEPLSSEIGGPSHGDGLAERLIVRYLEPHHNTAALLMHMIEQLVIEARRRLAEASDRWKGRRADRWVEYAREAEAHQDWEARGKVGPEPRKPVPPPGPKFDPARAGGPPAAHRIRLVIDDWALILSTFPEVRGNPKFLPALIQYLKGEGVSTLILANHQGNPTEELKDGLDPHFQELRSLSDYCLHTWQVSFFDERRVAITLLPPIQTGTGPQVRELRPARRNEILRHTSRGPDPGVHHLLVKANDQIVYDEEHLRVDPHFELYSGLERGTPTFVPLHVYLYAEREDVPAFQGYLSEIKNLFKQLFANAANPDVLQPQYGTTYDTLREFSYLQSETRLDHTLVLQVDEFWAESRAELRRLEEYLNARTVDYDDRPVLGEDPFGLFQLTEEMKRRRRPLPHYELPADGGGANVVRKYHGPFERRHFFDPIGYSLRTLQARYPVFKIPYTWDFGFLVCDAHAWKRYEHVSDFRTERVRQITPELWDRLRPDRQQDLLRDGSVTEKTLVGEIWDRVIRIEVYKPEVYDAKSQYLRQSQYLARLEVEVPAKQVGIVETSTGKATPHEVRWKQIFEKSPRPRAMRFAWFTQPVSPAKPQDQLKLDDLLTLCAPLNSVPEPGDSTVQNERELSEPVTWREFLGACGTIARETNYKQTPFDVDMLATESLPCLVFEVWMSELHQAVKEVLKNKLRMYKLGRYKVHHGPPAPGRPELSVGEHTLAQWRRILAELDQGGAADSDWPRNHRYWPRKRRDDWTSYCLSRLLDDNIPDAATADPDGDKAEIARIFRRALYRAILLLNEVLDIDRISAPDLNLKPRASTGSAIATRHWYSTATAAMAAADGRGKVVVGMPGNYAVRGDWFLAVARGSRSARLGERAMDILCSKRANITRLQHGLGLPVRDLHGHPDPAGGPDVHPDQQKRIEYWTSLQFVEDDGTRHVIDYKELRALGAAEGGAGTPPQADDPSPEGRDRTVPERIGRKDFHWFWRSSLESYDTHARIWQRWLCMLLRSWKGKWPAPMAPDEAAGAAPAHAVDLVPGEERGKPWWNGFREYDHYRRVEMHPAETACCYVDEQSPRYGFFKLMVDGLIETLGRSNRRQEEHP